MRVLKTGRQKDCDLSVKPVFRTVPDTYDITVLLMDENGNTIGRATGRLGSVNKNFLFSDKDASVSFGGRGICQ
jgi:hypothetical protein